MIDSKEEAFQQTTPSGFMNTGTLCEIKTTIEGEAH